MLKKALLLICIILICSLPLNAKEDSLKLEGKSYDSGPFTEPSGYYSIVVPVGWKGYVEGEQAGFITSRQGVFASCLITVTNIEEGTSPKVLKDKSLAQFKGNSKFSIILESMVTLDETSGILARMKNEVISGKVLLADEYYFVKNKKGYIIHFDTGFSSYELFKADFSAILNSFHFK